jgi:hypothetical protein
MSTIILAPADHVERQPVPREPVTEALARPDRAVLALARQQHLDLLPCVASALVPAVKPTLRVLERCDGAAESYRREFEDSRQRAGATEGALVRELDNGRCIIDDKPLRPGKNLFCSNRCESRYRDAVGEPRLALDRALADRLARVAQWRSETVGRLRLAEARALAERGHNFVRQRRERYGRLDQRLRAALDREARQASQAERYGTKGRTVEESDTAARLRESVEERIQKIRSALPRVAERRLVLELAWVAVREREAFERRSGSGVTVHCTVCQRAVDPTLSDEDRADVQFHAFCCQAHRRLWKQADFAGEHGRRCVGCNLWFQSDAPRIPILAPFELLDGCQRPAPTLADLCSVACWSAFIVDQDEPPAFPEARYLGPPLSASRSAGATALDRFVEYLREHGPATDKDAAAKMSMPLPTVRGVRRQAVAEGLVTGDGSRPERWRVVEPEEVKA